MTEESTLKYTDRLIDRRAGSITRDIDYIKGADDWEDETTGGQ